MPRPWLHDKACEACDVVDNLLEVAHVHSQVGCAQRSVGVVDDGMPGVMLELAIDQRLVPHDKGLPQYCKASWD